jgi:hypothetical protein
VQSKYGPPNYEENRKIDAKVKVPVLVVIDADKYPRTSRRRAQCGYVFAEFDESSWFSQTC